MVTQVIVNASAGDGDKVQLEVKVNGVNYLINNNPSVKLTSTQTEYTFVGNEVAGDIEISYSNATATASTKAVYWRSVEVTYSDGAVDPTYVATPSISDNQGVVTITCATEGASIYYTLDDSDPSVSSTLYKEPFEIQNDCTVKAIAVKDGNSSDIASKAVAVPVPYTIAKFLADKPATPVMVEGPLTVIYKNGSYLYVKDDADSRMLIFDNNLPETENGDVFSSFTGSYKLYGKMCPEMVNPVAGEMTKGTPAPAEVITIDQITDALYLHYVKLENVSISAINNKNFTVTDAAGNTYAGYNQFNLTVEAAENVTIEAMIGAYNSLQIQPISITGGVVVETVETPVFSPEAGKVVAGTLVTITCDTPDATIYYTLDGSVPAENSEEYTAPFAINADVTVKAVAVKEGMANSSVAVAEYTVVDPNLLSVTFDFKNYDYGMVRKEYNPDTNAFGSGVVSVVTTGNNGSRLWDEDLRFYKANESMTVSVPAGYEIKSIDANAIFTKDEEKSTANSWYYTSSATTTTKVASMTVEYVATADVALSILIDGRDAHEMTYNEQTLVTLTAPKGATIYYVWVANDPEVQSEDNIDSYDWIEAPTNPYSMEVGSNKGNILKVRSSMTGGEIAQLLFQADGTTRIESVVADGAEAPAEWFDLQGRRVAEPANGLYIRRQGRTATKVLVK